LTDMSGVVAPWRSWGGACESQDDPRVDFGAALRYDAARSARWLRRFRCDDAASKAVCGVSLSFLIL